MARLFELVVSFASEADSSVHRAIGLCEAFPIVEVGPRLRLRLKEPRLVRAISSPLGFIEFSVAVQGLKYGGASGAYTDRGPLDKVEVTALAHRLYWLLRQFDGYQAAAVGWDPEEMVDLRLVMANFPKTGSEGYDGLVMADKSIGYLGNYAHFEPFEPGFKWLPYRGTSI